MQTTIDQVRGSSLKKQVDFLIAVSKGEQVPDAPKEVRDLHRAVVLNALARAANRVKPYAEDSAFARDTRSWRTWATSCRGPRWTMPT